MRFTESFVWRADVRLGNFLIAVILLANMPVQPALADKRVGLVGNSAYKHQTDWQFLATSFVGQNLTRRMGQLDGSFRPGSDLDSTALACSE